MKVEFQDGFAVGYEMAVAECFRDSLAKERFNVGDIIYNDRRAHLPSWSEAVRHVTYAFQVIQMTGEEIEYAILRKKAGNQSFAREATVKEPISKFIELLKTGL